MACFDNIVSIGVCADEPPSISGYRLIDAAGISAEGLAKIAGSDDVSGISLAKSKLNIATLRVKNDFLSSLTASNVVSNISTQKYVSGNIQNGIPAGLSQNYRGVTLHAVSQGDIIKRLELESVSFIPLSSGAVVLRLEDGFDAYSYTIQAAAGSLNNVPIKLLTGTDYYVCKSGTLRVLMLNDVVEVCKSSIVCMKGCGGSMPNPCAWVDGWDGSYAVKSDGFGLSVSFRCNCNYDDIFCQISPTVIGELVFLAWQLEVMQEAAMSDRFNSFVVYRKQDIIEVWLPELAARYKEKWSAFADNFKSTIGSLKSDCINCMGVKWVTNL